MTAPQPAVRQAYAGQVRPVLPRAAARRIVAALTAWLGDPSRDSIAASTRAWTANDWPLAQRLITINGLASHLVGVVAAQDLREQLPAEVHDWLIEQDRLTGLRVELMHEELRAILAASTAASVEVMPLKGALLTASATGDRRNRRSMADLDLLVRPTDRDRVRGVLEALGYELRPEANPRPTHDVYGRREGETIASIDEHPDNPRWVEVHTDVVRHLWGWLRHDELTARLWSGASRGLLLGQPVTLPDRDALFAHLAIHASSDLLVGRGRLIQWVDLAAVATGVSGYRSMPHPRLAYPALRIAARAQPDAFPVDELDALESAMPPSLARWAATVPLDDRCGLMISFPGPPSSLRERWRRWAPARWRMAVAYGQAPLPVALARHASMLSHTWRGRLRPSDARHATGRPDPRRAP